MQTRQKSRRNINVPARYFTGIGDPVDVVLRDISEGGCRFPLGSARLAVGTPIQISIGGAIPVRGKVRWVEDGEAGINFNNPITADMVEKFKSCHLYTAPGAPAAAPSDFAPMPTGGEQPTGVPRRFC